LQALHYQVPAPTSEALAQSTTLQDSRKSITLSDRAKILLMRRPDTFEAARVGEPTMVSPADTTAPQVIKNMNQTYMAAVNPQAAAEAAKNTAAAKPAAETPSTEQQAAAPAATGGTLQLQDVSNGAGTSGNSAATDVQGSGSSVREVAPGTNASSNVGVGLGVVGTGSPDNSTQPAAQPAVDPKGGLKTVGPTDNTPLPAVEKAAAAPDTVNDVAGVQTPGAAAPGSKPTEDKKSESSTKKKKKGLAKLIP
jgi:outer membrane protein assembly factor BamD